MTADNRIGVWVDEEGRVCRKDSEKEYSPRIYTPLTPDLLPQVLEKARILYDGAGMGSWSAAVEAAQDRTLEELKKLIEA